VSKSESMISYGNRISQFGFTDMFGMSKTAPNALPQKQVQAEEEGKRGDSGQKQGAMLREDAGELNEKFLKDMGLS